MYILKLFCLVYMFGHNTLTLALLTIKNFLMVVIELSCCCTSYNYTIHYVFLIYMENMFVKRVI